MRHDEARFIGTLLVSFGIFFSLVSLLLLLTPKGPHMMHPFGIILMAALAMVALGMDALGWLVLGIPRKEWLKSLKLPLLPKQTGVKWEWAPLLFVMGSLLEDTVHHPHTLSSVTIPLVSLVTVIVFLRAHRSYYRLNHNDPDMTWWRFLKNGTAVQLVDEVVQATGDVFRILKTGTPFEHDKLTLLIHFYSPPTVETVTMLMCWMQNLPAVDSPEFNAYVAQAAHVNQRITPHLPFWIELRQKPAN